MGADAETAAANVEVADQDAASQAADGTLGANDPRTVTGDIFQFMIRGGTYDGAGIELGIYFICLTFCMFGLLDQVRGKTHKLSNWLLFRKLALAGQGKRNSAKIRKCLNPLLAFYMAMPFLTLLGWSILILYDNAKEDRSAISAFCILFLGIFVLLFGYNVLRVKWRNYRFKKINLIALFVGIGLLSLYQLMVTFGYESDEKFFPYSAVFLNINVTLLSILIFVSKYQDAKGKSHLITKFFPEGGPVLDPDRANDMAQEIEAQSKDPNWRPSQEDLMDIVTISKVSGVKFDSATGADSMLKKFRSMTVKTRRLVQLGVVIVAYAIVAVYAVVLAAADDGNKLGIITAASVGLMDLYNFMLYNSSTIETPSGIIFLLILNRALMISLGQHYWIYGYMVLYLIYGLVFVYQLTQNRFPFESDIVLKNSKIEGFIKSLRDKREGKEVLKMGFRNPEILLVVLSLFYMILMLIVSFVEFSGRDALKHLSILDKEIPYWACGLLSVFLVISSYFALALWRIFVRTATRADIYGQRVDSCLNTTKKLSLLDFYMIFNCVIVLLWAGVAYWISEKEFWFIYGAFAPLAIMFFAKGYVYFVLNEYDYFQDVTKLNRVIDRHNQDIEDMENNKRQIQHDLVNGILVLPQLREDNEPSLPLAPGRAVGTPDQPTVPPSNPSQGQQQADVQELIEKENERKRNEEEDRKRQLEQNAELAEKQRLERERMEEQMRLERERAQKDKEQAEKQRIEEAKRIAEIQKNEEAKRREEEAKKPKVQPAKSPYNFSGQMQMGFVPPASRGGGGHAQDEVYEGGGDDARDEANPSAPSGGQQPQVMDPTKEYLDIDEAERNREQDKIARTRLKRVVDWRLRHSSWIKAYRAKEMRPNDKKFISSMLISFGFTLLLMLVLFIDMDDFIAVISFLPFAYFAVCLLIASTVLYQSRALGIKELIAWGFVNVVYFGCGIAYFIQAYEVSEFEYDLEKRSEEQETASYFVFFYVLAMPTLAHGLVVVLRLIDRGTEEFDRKFKAFGGIFLFGVLLIALSAFVFVELMVGFVIVAVIAAIIYTIAQFAVYIKNDYYLKPIWHVINSILVVCCCLATTIYAVASDEISTYEGVSYSAAVLLFFLWAYALFQFVRDLMEVEHRPLYFSATLFPIFKFNQKKNDIESHYGPAISWTIGLIILLFWAFLTNYQVLPEWYGVIATICVELIFLLSIINMRQITLDSVDAASDFIDWETAKKAWIETKLCHIRNQTVVSRQALLTYRSAWVRRHFINGLISAIKNTKFNNKEPLASDLKDEIAVPAGTDAKAFYQNKVDEFLEDTYDIEDICDLELNSHIYDTTVHETFSEELQQIIKFIMISVQTSLMIQDQKKKGFIRFLMSKKDTLHALGLDVQVPTKGNINMKWELIENQIDELDPKKQLVFKRLRLLYENEQSANKQISLETEKEERRRNDERDKLGDQLHQRKQEQLDELDRKREKEEWQQFFGIDMDIDSMPDCRLKYELIVKKAKARGEKFKDAQFLAEDRALGDGLVSKFAERRSGRDGIDWPRMSDAASGEGPYQLFEDGVDVNDVEQGQCGDCYFLSAIAVLGNQLTRDKFVFIDSEDEWQKCGAFCVKFYNQGVEEIVIVDDHLPHYKDGRLCFAKSPSGRELWPCILEKAHAKKYGSYSAIEGGQVYKSLAQLTNGIPDWVRISDEQNLQTLWDRVYGIHREGSFLGAGSPSHPEGDRKTTDTGIVQGHAYSILRVAEVDGFKLLQLRNPWGSKEWTGDWSDQSSRWTTRMQNVLNYKTFEEDGVFWMEFSDFTHEFVSIYICRNFANLASWKNDVMHDEWRGEYAEGLVTGQHHGAKMEKNPQFGITVSKAGQGHFVLRLKELEDERNSVQSGYLNIQCNNGAVIDYTDFKKKTIGKKGPRNAPMQHLEVEFPNNLRYPYTFTALVANTEHGRAGEGHFSLQVFSKDLDMAVEKLN